MQTNNHNTLKALVALGTNTSVQCDTKIASSTQFEPSLWFNVAHCPSGFSPLHIAAMYGYHSTAELLIKYGANVNTGDCSGSTPLHIASCHGFLSLVTLLVENGADSNAASLNGSTPLHSAAACYAKAIFRPLFEFGCDYYDSDNNGMTALDYVVKDVDFVGSEYLIDLYARQPKDWIEYVKGVYQVTARSTRNEKYPWLEAFIELVVCYATTGTIKNSLLSTVIDKKTRTLLVKLVQKTNVSKILLGSNECRLRQFVQALTPCDFVVDFVFNEHVKSAIELQNPTKIVTCSAKFLVKTFPTLYPEATDCSPLFELVTWNLVYGMNTALKLGLDVNCCDLSGMTPVLG